MDERDDSIVNFPAIGKDEKKDLDSFLSRVNEIESLVKGLSSEDKSVADASIKSADLYLAKHQPKRENCEEEFSDLNKKKSNRKAINKTVINEKAFKQLDKNYRDEMNPDEFMKVMEEDAQKRSEDRKIRMNEAEELKRQADLDFSQAHFDQALQLYNQAISKIKDWVLLYTSRAQVRIQLKQYKEALEDCDWAFRVDEKSLNAFVTQGKVYQCMGEYEKAIEIFQKAIEVKPLKKHVIQEYLNKALKEQDLNREIV